MKIVHEIFAGAIPSTGGTDGPAHHISIRLVGRNPITGEADVLDMEGKDTDILDALDQMVAQVRTMIIASGRPDPHVYVKAGVCGCPECPKCGVTT